MNDVEVAIEVAEAGSAVRDSVHFAAGLALCEAAGCTLSDLRGNAYGNGATGLIVGADFKTHADVVTLVRKFLR